MSTPILATKFYIPQARPDVILRSRLLAQLNAGTQRKLTLISAAAGYGKTTLISSWLAGCRQPTAWLSLDEGDSDLARFLVYFVAALQRLAQSEGEGLAPNLGNSVLAALKAPQPLQDPATCETVLTMLLNEIAALPRDFALVLDDYHLIDAAAVDQALTFLLDHAPPQLHLMIATREDPNLPLARYRARGQLTEVRAADLRFTPAEAADFLNGVMGLTLSGEEVSALDARTEGWIAGLQLAALSMQGRSDTASFIAAFAGSHHFILDYLLEEVLQRQPDHLRRFLLQSAILGRLSGPLCAAVTGQADSEQTLATLERGNLFLIALDDQRQWYRYHHLFADVLHARLLKEQPEAVAQLHQRASAWYAQHDQPAEAIRHALAAQNFGRAADLLELAWPVMDRNLQSPAWLRWVQMLPAALVQMRPLLRVGWAWALLDRGDLEAGQERLQATERWLAEADAGETMVVVDEAQLRLLPVTIANAHAYYAQARGDIPAAIRYARQALDLLPADAHLQRAAASLLALTYWSSGDLLAARQPFGESITLARLAGEAVMTIGASSVLADIIAAQGHLREAAAAYTQALQEAEKMGQPAMPGVGELLLGLSEVYCEWGDLATAEAYLQQSQEANQQIGLPNSHYRWHLAKARLCAIQGDGAGALDLLTMAERLYVRTPLPDIRPVTAIKARLWLAQGRLPEAMAWAQARGLTVEDELGYLREYEQLTLVRLLIAQYRQEGDAALIDGVLRLLTRLLPAAEAGARLGSRCEILLLQALAYAAQGAPPSALTALAHTLTLAEPEGYVRLFVDEGEPLAQLLQRMKGEGERMKAYVAKLLAAFGTPAALPPSPTIPHPSSFIPQPLIEPLSEREVEVLRLIAQGLTNPEICERLFLALDTVKGHNRRIFGKLQVQRRTEAVARARALGLV